MASLALRDALTKHAAEVVDWDHVKCVPLGQWETMNRQVGVSAPDEPAR